LRFIQEEPVVNEWIAPRVFPDLTDRRESQKVVSKRKYACLHPGSGSNKKNWPIKNFIQVAEYFLTTGLEIIWILGPAENRLQDEIEKSRTGRILTNVTLPVLAAVLESCSLFVGNDSGISHLAASVNAPVIALFGESDEKVWAPRGEKITIIKALDDKVESISVKDVILGCKNLITAPSASQ
jgi:ADP-heptose:LPS heptosyltransferase